MTTIQSSVAHVRSPIPGKMPRLLFARATVLVLNIVAINQFFLLFFTEFPDVQIRACHFSVHVTFLSMSSIFEFY